MKKTIRVTQEHIDRGAKLSTRRCPIALALEEDADLKKLEARVGATRLWRWLGVYEANVDDSDIADSNIVTICSIPLKAEQFVKAFDGGEFVQPFEFEIDLPD
jgi:hypothetical protein